MENIKRNYKDNLFVSIFGKSSGAKENFLSIYNAIHDTNLKIEETKIEPMMLENVVYTGLNNDVSMLINDKIIVLAEQQSTINENMPFRCLEYVTRIYEKLFESKEKYKKRLLKFPNPEFYVFYNGEEKYPKEKILKLSDAFLDSASNKFSLELTVKVYNINYKENHPILAKSLALLGYSKFVDHALSAKNNGEKNYIASAIEKCMSENLLSDYLRRLTREDKNMIFGEYNYEEDIAVQREEAAEYARLEAKLEDAVIAVTKLGAKAETVSELYNVPLSDLQEALSQSESASCHFESAVIPN